MSQRDDDFLDAYGAAQFLGTTYKGFDNLARREALQPDGYRGRARVWTRKSLTRLVQMIRDRKDATGSVAAK